MKANADFFCKTSQQLGLNKSEKKPDMGDGCVGKVNFVEIRTFWHLFRSFDRMWSFYILSLQAMIIIAWNETSESGGAVFHKVLSVFITAAKLNLFQAFLDIALSWKARHSMSTHVRQRYIFKAVAAAVWVLLMPLTYAYSHTSIFIVAILIYLSPNMLPEMLLLIPSIRRTLEKSDFRPVKLIMWWSQPELYIGRGMHESAWSIYKYMMFWIVLLTSKLAFSYYVEIKPLMGPTKEIMSVPMPGYWLPEFFPHVKNNRGVVITLWSPVILVYFMDTQIWYAIVSTLVGGLYGAFRHIGEIQTLGMLRSRFQSLPGAFNACLIPNENTKEKGIKLAFSRKCHKIPNTNGKEAKQFSQMWNTIINSFREEDLISNRELELLLMPCWAYPDLDFIRWPIFLLASKIPIAVDIAKKRNGKHRELKNILAEDNCMSCAVRECYASIKKLLNTLVTGNSDLMLITTVFTIIDTHIEKDTLLTELNLSVLPDLHGHFVKLTEYVLQNKDKDKIQIVNVLLKILEMVTKDILKEEIKRLHLLLTVKESAMDVPSNLEARRRLTFFSNSLFMEMPGAPKIQNMLSFSALTPYYSEDVLFSTFDLEKENDGVSILFYLQKIFPDEWKNFLERVKCGTEEELDAIDYLKEEIRLWASYRGQTLTKTVRGMMYYQKALELQAFFDLANERELMKGYKSAEASSSGSSLWAECQALADIKFTYVVACQQYSIHKRSGDQRAKDILTLMTTYPSLRVAYIDEVEQTHIYSKGTSEKFYYSALVKAAPQTYSTDSSDSGHMLDQVIYQIKLPGPPIIGEGKPENQNNAIIFTRGEALQTIDMNQDYYIEEAFKMRNLLQEFLEKNGGVRYPTILGLREHIFTRSVSCLAWFMSNQEHSFVTIGQRVLANPLKVRFHYGHPDVFDRVFHLTRGGVSKASKVINLSEDIFAGFNSTLREGTVSHHEYIQVGKGRDVGLNQISMFEAKIANGSGEQTLSRDLYRLGHQFDFFRMLSCYFTTVGFYFCSMLTVLTVYVFLYGRLYLVLSGVEKELGNKPMMMEIILASQSFVQIVFLMAMPMIMEIGLERGFYDALFDFVLMQLQLASVFFTFQLGTKFHYYCKTLLHGGAEYRGTGRGFVVFHAKFAENYRFYSRSHFVKATELGILLLVYHIFGPTYIGLFTISIWFMVGTWLFAPFLFNPSGFEWHEIVEDWADWKKWIEYDNGGIGVPPEKSWESWWEKDIEHLQHSGKWGIVVEIFFALRFFIFQYGLVYQLSAFKNKYSSLWVFGASWLLILILLLTVTVLDYARRRLGTEFQLLFRIIKVSLFLAFMAIFITLMTCRLILPQDVFLCMLALIPTGWGLLLIAQSCKPLIQQPGIWSWVMTLAWVYDLVMGSLLFIPIAFMAWFPFISEFQTRMLFNQAFSRGLHISRILSGQRKHRSSKNKD
ncbi:Callose synthase 4 [Arabidopsis thaliana]